MAKLKDAHGSVADLLGAIENATAEDIARLDEAIKEKEEQLAQATKKLEAEIRTLKTIRRILDHRFNGTPLRQLARKPRQPRTKTEQAPANPPETLTTNLGQRGRPPLLNRIVGALSMQPNLTASKLAARLGNTDAQKVLDVLTSRPDLFERNSDHEWNTKE